MNEENEGREETVEEESVADGVEGEGWSGGELGGGTGLGSSLEEVEGGILERAVDASVAGDVGGPVLQVLPELLALGGGPVVDVLECEREAVGDALEGSCEEAHGGGRCLEDSSGGGGGAESHGEVGQSGNEGGEEEVGERCEALEEGAELGDVRLDLLELSLNGRVYAFVVGAEADPGLREEVVPGGRASGGGETAVQRSERLPGLEVGVGGLVVLREGEVGTEDVGRGNLGGGKGGRREEKRTKEERRKGRKKRGGRKR